MRISACAVVLVVAAGWPVSVGWAGEEPEPPTTRSWSSVAGGVFSLEANWLGGVAPRSIDHTLYDLDASYTVMFDSDTETHLNAIARGDVTFDLGGHVYTSTTVFPETSMQIGNSASPAGLRVLNGTFNHNRILLGNINFPAAGSSPSLTLGAGAIVGTDVLWVNSALGGKVTIEAGAQYTGRLTLVSNNGSLSETHITGSGTVANFTGSGGGALEIGAYGRGSALIDGGASVSGNITMTTNNGSPTDQVASLRITGAGTTADLNNLNIGMRGVVSAAIDGGAVVDISTALGVSNPGGLTVSGVGTALNYRSSFNLIAGPTGETTTVRFEDGATSTNAPSGGTQLGGAGGGRIEVDGLGTSFAVSRYSDFFDATPIQLGASFSGPGAGSFAVLGGATARTEGSVFVGQAQGEGLLELSGAGSRFDIERSLVVGDVQTGLVTLDPGTILKTNTLDINATGKIINNGGRLIVETVRMGPGAELEGNGVVEGSVDNEGGSLRTGSLAGGMDILGNYSQDQAGESVFELSGGALRMSEASVLSVTGTATLAGLLRVEVLPDFVPVIGAEFTLLHAAGGLIGAFDQVQLPSLEGDFWLVLGTTGGEVRLRVVPVPSTAALLLCGAGCAARRRRA